MLETFPEAIFYSFFSCSKFLTMSVTSQKRHPFKVLQASACNTDTTPTQPHRNSNTHRTKNNTTNVVIQQNTRKLLMMDILMSETCWAHKKWNKIASDIKLAFYSSTSTFLYSQQQLLYSIPGNSCELYENYLKVLKLLRNIKMFFCCGDLLFLVVQYNSLTFWRWNYFF